MFVQILVDIIAREKFLWAIFDGTCAVRVHGEAASGWRGGAARTLPHLARRAGLISNLLITEFKSVNSPTNHQLVAYYY